MQATKRLTFEGGTATAGQEAVAIKGMSTITVEGNGEGIRTQGTAIRLLKSGNGARDGYEYEI
jgi:hypothetical protein